MVKPIFLFLGMTIGIVSALIIGKATKWATEPTTIIGICLALSVMIFSLMGLLVGAVV